MPKILIKFDDVYDDDDDGIFDPNFDLKRKNRKKNKNIIDVSRGKIKDDNAKD